MTSYHNYTKVNYSAIARTARRCIRIYCAVVHWPQPRCG